KINVRRHLEKTNSCANAARTTPGPRANFEKLNTVAKTAARFRCLKTDSRVHLLALSGAADSTWIVSKINTQHLYAIATELQWLKDLTIPIQEHGVIEARVKAWSTSRQMTSWSTELAMNDHPQDRAQGLVAPFATPRLTMT